MGLVGKFRRLFAEEGAGAALVQTLHYVAPNWLFFAHCGYIVRNDLAALPPYEGSEIVRWATARDLQDIRRFDEYCEDLAGWVERGDRFAVAIRDGQIVGFENYQNDLHWLVPAKRIGVRLDNDELWAVFSLVDPRYRRRGIVNDIIRFASRRLIDDGYRFVYGHIARGDIPAKKAHGKRGFAPIDVWRIYRVLGTTFFSSRLIRRRGRWTDMQPLEVRVRDASGGAGGSTRNSEQRLAPVGIGSPSNS